MNREDIIRMALEAGFENSEYGLNCTPGMYAYNMEIIERFADLVAAAEREACAKVCDDIFRHWLQTDPEEKLATPDADDCARAIRARGENNG